MSRWYEITLVLQLICNSVALQNYTSTKNTPYPLNVLCAENPPFAYFDTGRRYLNGIDSHALNLMSQRLNLNTSISMATNVLNSTAEYLE